MKQWRLDAIFESAVERWKDWVVEWWKNWAVVVVEGLGGGVVEDWAVEWWKDWGVEWWKDWAVVAGPLVTGRHHTTLQTSGGPHKVSSLSFATQAGLPPASRGICESSDLLPGPARPSL